MAEVKNEGYKDYFVVNGKQNWYSVGSTEETFDWAGFQKWMQFTDEELAAWKADPKKVAGTLHMFSNGIVNKWLVVEVVKSHGCGNGHRVGDQLWWKACGHLVCELSDDWCGHNMSYMGLMQDAVHNLVMQGGDPNSLYPDHFSCVDTTCKLGWGYVESKVFLVDEADMPKYFSEGLKKEKYERYLANIAKDKAKEG